MQSLENLFRFDADGTLRDTPDSHPYAFPDAPTLSAPALIVFEYLLGRPRGGKGLSLFQPNFLSYPITQHGCVFTLYCCFVYGTNSCKYFGSPGTFLAHETDTPAHEKGSKYLLYLCQM